MPEPSRPLRSTALALLAVAAVGLEPPAASSKEPAAAPRQTPPGVGSTRSPADSSEVPSEQEQQNTANNPLTDITAVQVQTYLQPSLSGTGSTGSNQPYLRAVLPFNGLGMRQLMRVSLPTGVISWGAKGTTAGLGDLEVFVVPVFPVGRGRAGIGPLLVVPTATSDNLGDRSWQLGLQGVVSFPYRWGLMAALIGYQQAIGSELRSLTFQPFLFRTIGNGYYLRSSAIATLNLQDGTGVLPVGLGVGKVSRLADGKILNVYLEPQLTLLRQGDGQPGFQLFAGFNLQFPARR